MWRLSIVSVVLVGAYWLIRYYVTGNIPVVASLKMTETWNMALPFGVPRWCDVFVGPLFICSVIYLCFRARKPFETTFAVVAGLILGLIVGVVFVGIAVNLRELINFGLLMGAFVAFLSLLGMIGNSCKPGGSEEAWTAELGYVVKTVLGFMWSVGFITGLKVCLLAGLIVALGCTLYVCLYSAVLCILSLAVFQVLKFVFSERAWAWLVKK
jgi:hypothetical protein